MDPPFSPNGFIYDPLHNLSITMRNPPSITSWSSSNNAERPSLFQEGSQHSPYSGSSMMESFRPVVENPLLPFASSTSLNPTFPSFVAPCHPLDYPQANNTSINEDTDMLESSCFNPCFGHTMLTLSSHFDMRHSINLSRSSSTSTMACIDPAALILNSNQGSSNASPCISTPGSRRHSSFSICGDLENDDDQHAEMHSMFEGNFTLSTPPLTARTSATQEHHVPTQPFMQDLVLPDGAVYRFDGTSLVAVSRSHFGDMSNSRNASPSLTPAPFTNNSAMNHALSMMIPPRASLTDITHFGPPMLPTSSGEEPERAVRHRETRGRSIIKSLSLKNLSLKNLSLKNLSLKKNSVVRRTSLDSASSSSSCSTGPPHSDMSSCNTLGSGSGSSSNNIVNNIKYRKEGTGEFQCPFDNCTYRYNLRRELNRHRNVHLYAGKDKYRCMNCNSGLCRLDSVKRHMEAKGKAECLKKGLYQEFKENGELVRVRKCKPSWYEAAAANAAAALNSCKP